MNPFVDQMDTQSC